MKCVFTEKKKIKNIVFDFGDTLVEAIPSVASIFLSCLKEKGMEGFSYKTIDTLLDQNSKKFIFSELNSKSRRDQYIEKNKLILSEFICGENIIEEVAYSIFDSCKSMIHWRLFGDVNPVIEQLSRRYSLYIFSNWNKNLIDRVNELGIARYFDGIFSSSKLKKEKPDINFFKKMVSVIGALEEECMYVGNDYFLDIEPLKKTEIIPYFLDRKSLYPKKMTQFQFSDLYELIRIVEGK